MRKASLNHAYRLVWSGLHQAFIAVAEYARSRSKGGRRAVTLLASALLLSGAAQAVDLPSGGRVVAGTGSISQSGNTMTITQSTSKLAVDWQSFNIGQGHTVNFVQPSASAVALNRVLGSDVSVIQGALNANGQVFLINPNGVMFTKDAQVNVGGIVASTLNISTADFMAGNYQFAGTGSNAIINQGRIKVGAGGTAALIAARITNTGSIDAPQGNVLLGAGNKVTLDLGGPVKIEVTQGAIDALIEQGGAIKADGGLVYLTAKAANLLTTTVINHTGITEAQTLATGETGEIYLMGGMTKDRIAVGGTLDASAPNGGKGGFIETSAGQVRISPDARVTTAALSGTMGTWLIDPNDFTIAASGGNVSGGSLSTALGDSNIIIDTATAGTGGGNGDVFVNDNVTWTSGSNLTLRAERDINVNQPISHRSGSGDLILRSDSNADGVGTVRFGSTGSVDYRGSSGNVKLYYNPVMSGGRKYAKPTNFSTNILMGDADNTSGGLLIPMMLVNNAADLQLLNTEAAPGGGASSGIFALGADIDASSLTAFAPIGAGSLFGGYFDGDYHTISNLNISSSLQYVGLFSSLAGAVVKNLTLRGGSVTSTSTNPSKVVGALAGSATWSTISNVVNDNDVTATAVSSATESSIGGIVGSTNNGTLVDVINRGTVTGYATNVGGVVGRGGNGASFGSHPTRLYRLRNTGQIIVDNSSAITSDVNVGGIVGASSWGLEISDAINSGDITVKVNTSRYVSIAGLVGGGVTEKALTFSSNSGNILLDGGGNARNAIGGLWGSFNSAAYGTVVSDSFNIGNITVTSNIANPSLVIGGLFGVSPGPNGVTADRVFSDFTLSDASSSATKRIGGLIGETYGAARISGYWANASITRASGDNVALRSGSVASQKTQAELRNPDTYDATWQASLSFPTNSTPQHKSFALIYGDAFLAYALTSAYAYSNAAASAHLVRVGVSSTEALTTSASIGPMTGWVWTPAYKSINTTSATVSIPGTYSTVLTPSTEVALLDRPSSLSWRTVLASTASSTATGTVTPYVLPSAVTYTFGALSGTYTYNGNPYSLTNLWSAESLFGATYNTWVLGTDYTFKQGGSTVTSFTNAGTYGNITVDILKSNFFVASAGNTVGNLTIAPAPLTVSADAKSKTYGAADPALTYSITAGQLFGSDSLSGALSRVAGNNAGTYAIQQNTLANGNYAITYNGANLTIDSKVLNIIGLWAQNKVYDGTVGASISGMPTLEGVIEGDTVTMTGTAAGQFANANVGNAKPVSVTGLSLDGTHAGNYTVGAPAGLTADITARPLTVTADTKSKIYGNVDPALTYAITTGSLVGGDSLSGALTRAAGENVGSYAIDASALANGNYLITAHNGTLTISQRPLTVTADNTSKTAGQTDPSLTWQLTHDSTLLGNDTLAGRLDRASGETAGPYAIGQGSLTNSNYLIRFIDGLLTINPAVTDNPAITVAQTVALPPPVVVSPSVMPAPLPLATIGGLTFVNIPGESGGSTGGTGNSSTGNTGASPHGTPANDGAGRDPAGFMKVFVVAGGINLGGRLNAAGSKTNDDAASRRRGN